MTHTSLVAFDLDDTLVPEVLFLKSGIYHIAKQLSLRWPQLQQQRIISRMETAILTRCNHYSALENLLEETQLRDRINMADVVMEFRNHVPDPDIYHLSPSVRKILTDLQKRDIPIALITDGRSITQRNKIASAGLHQFIDDSYIFISGETGHDKNDPDNFLSLMEKHAGIKKFIYVADNPKKDFLHPKRLGWETYLVHPFPLAIHQGIPR